MNQCYFNAEIMEINFPYNTTYKKYFYIASIIVTRNLCFKFNEVKFTSSFKVYLHLLRHTFLHFFFVIPFIHLLLSSSLLLLILLHFIFLRLLLLLLLPRFLLLPILLFTLLYQHFDFRQFCHSCCFIRVYKPLIYFKA